MPVKTVKLGVTPNTHALVALIAEATGEQRWQVLSRLVNEEVDRLEAEGRLSKGAVRSQMLRAGRA